MCLNKAQTKALQHFTNRVYHANLMTSGENLNGAINFALAIHEHAVQVIVSNAENKRWYETSILVIAFIGPRGGVRLYHVEGVGKQLIK